MPYSFTSGGSLTTVSATELVISVFDQVDSEFHDVLYPEILFRSEFDEGSIKTDINPGALNWVGRLRDIKGTGQFLQGSSRNIPRVGQVVGQIIVPIQGAAVGATLMNDEAERYAFGYQSALAQDYGAVMKRAADYHVERVLFFGDTPTGFLPYLSFPNVTVITGSLFANGTPADWFAQINDAITTVWTNSLTVHLPNVVELPPAKFALLTQAYVIGAGATGVAISVLEYLRQNNVYTAQTGKPLTIRSLRYLTGAGVGGLDRAIIKEELPRNVVIPFPKPYQLAQPVPIALGVEMFAEYKFGSFYQFYPLAMGYIDGI